MGLLRLKLAGNQFKANHLKMLLSAKATSRDGIMGEGTLIEIIAISSTGQTITSNIWIEQSDLEFPGAFKDTLGD